MDIKLTDTERAHVQNIELALMKLRVLEADKNDEMQKLSDDIENIRKQQELGRREFQSAIRTLAVVHECGADWELKQDRSGFIKHEGKP